ncbi:predicted protein [Thalassiosira pseudonana CCMP1335]|uniref:Uncharacterized protein n=1 Tax=Thalassiosira pseudonana TaxID=35128 RepID=B8CGL2_THAPS|nr:predicted protein [Thalassiosira pseudonana CCMP1335]EED87347.1 predicted protein [Thalassiosira pseudonana CCMP1335]
MRVIQLVITIALLSYQESSGVAALSSPLRGAERRAKSGKTTKKKGNSEEATKAPITNAPTSKATTPPATKAPTGGATTMCSLRYFHAFTGKLQLEEPQRKFQLEEPPGNLVRVGTRVLSVHYPMSAVLG